MNNVQNIKTYTALIERCFPQSRVHTALPITSGWDSFVLEVNGELIFRFPMREDVVRRIEQEVRLLPILEQELSTPIPHFDYIGHGNGEYPYLFVGYRKIGGMSLTDESITHVQLWNLVPALARFLSELHSFPMELAPRAGFPDRTPEQWRSAWRQEFQDRYDDLQLRVFPLLDEEMRRKTRKLWEDFLNTEEHFAFRPALAHCDLGCEHIFCDPERGILTGVIDWGDATVGDPALDFVGLLLRHRREFTEQVLARYQGEVDAFFWRRIDFYSCYPPYSELLYGAYGGGQKFIEQGLAGLREIFHE
jgi:aminoglycoside 2''-phosphotransferase